MRETKQNKRKWRSAYRHRAHKKRRRPRNQYAITPSHSTASWHIISSSQSGTRQKNITASINSANGIGALARPAASAENGLYKCAAAAAMP